MSFDKEMKKIKIDVSQLKNSDNSVDMTIEKEDINPSDFSEKQAPNRDQRDGDIMSSDANLSFDKFAEMSRFNKQHKISIEKE